MDIISGTAREKAKMLFDMYDIKNRGYLSREDFSKMIRSVLCEIHAEVNEINKRSQCQPYYDTCHISLVVGIEEEVN